MFSLNVNILLLAIECYINIYNESSSLSSIPFKSKQVENTTYNGFNTYHYYSTQQLKSELNPLPIFDLTLSIFLSIFQQVLPPFPFLSFPPPLLYLFSSFFTLSHPHFSLSPSILYISILDISGYIIENATSSIRISFQLLCLEGLEILIEGIN